MFIKFLPSSDCFYRIIYELELFNSHLDTFHNHTRCWKQIKMFVPETNKLLPQWVSDDWQTVCLGCITSASIRAVKSARMKNKSKTHYNVLFLIDFQIKLKRSLKIYCPLCFVFMTTCSKLFITIFVNTLLLLTRIITTDVQTFWVLNTLGNILNWSPPQTLCKQSKYLSGGI